IEFQEQDELKATYSPKIERSSGEIVWSLDKALDVERKFKAYFPWPGIYTVFKGKRLKIHAGHATQAPITHAGQVRRMGDEIGVDAKEGVFVLEELQLEGKGQMKVQDFVRGYPDFLGSVLGE
ncbi:MAG: hypothetical protein Q8P27_02955, partial [Candidatus Peregrinibacteria bacterium]|nr:hypothetical protein [Candidatus Peregrinibacteria bacterium]